MSGLIDNNMSAPDVVVQNDAGLTTTNLSVPDTGNQTAAGLTTINMSAPDVVNQNDAGLTAINLSVPDVGNQSGAGLTSTSLSVPDVGDQTDLGLTTTNLSVPDVGNQIGAGLTTTDKPDHLNITSSLEDAYEDDDDLSADEEEATPPAPVPKRKFRKRPPKLFIDRDLRERSGKGSVGIGYFVTRAVLDASVVQLVSRKRDAAAAMLNQPAIEPPAKKRRQRKPKDANARERDHYNELTATGHLDYENVQAGSHVTSAIVTPEGLRRLPKPVNSYKEFDDSPAQKAEAARKMDFLTSMGLFHTATTPAPTPQTTTQQTVDLTSSDLIDSQVPVTASSNHGATDNIPKPVPKKVLADKTNIQRQVTSQRAQDSIEPTSMDMLAAAAKKQPMQNFSSSAKAAGKKRSRAEAETVVVETSARPAQKLRVDSTPAPKMSAAQASAAPIPAVANMGQAITEMKQLARKEAPKKSQGKRTRDATEDEDVTEVLPAKKNKIMTADPTQMTASMDEAFPKPQKKRNRDDIEMEDEVEALPAKKTKVRTSDLTEVEASPNDTTTESMTEEGRTEAAEVEEVEASDADVDNARSGQPEVDSAEEDGDEEEETRTTTATKTVALDTSDTHVAPAKDADAEEPRVKGRAYSLNPKPKAKPKPKGSAKKLDVRRVYTMDC